MPRAQSAIFRCFVLARAGEVDEDEFWEQGFEVAAEEEDDGWASDTTEKAAPAGAAPDVPELPASEESGNSEAWMREFSKFKKSQKKAPRADDDGTSSLADTMSFGGSSVMTGGTMAGGKRRRRRDKKSGTESTGYSMTSSSLFRTEGLTLLDDRFDRVSGDAPA